MNDNTQQNRLSLFRWIWLSYLRTALVPLLLVELVFIGIYFFTNNWSRNEMTSFLKNEISFELRQTSSEESMIVNNQLISIRNAADLYRKQAARAVFSNAGFDSADSSRLAYSKEGIYYTTRDRKDGGAAVFYSGNYKVGESELAKTARFLTLQPLMKDILTSEQLAAAIYINTFDSLNIIYPYFDVISQYEPHMDIPKYNFYYEADAAHNPNRKIRWTDAYLDPAGNGWMASAIGPVYNKDFLEGVIGIDVTISTITTHILNLEIPWDGYGMLLGKDGTILALPPKGEPDWGLRELKGHDYVDTIKQDTFKPEEFNLYKRKNLSEFTKNIAQMQTGQSFISLNNSSKLVSWSTIAETGWKLIIVVPENNIYLKVSQTSRNLFFIGLFMISGLIFFYSIFFAFLAHRARKMSQNIIGPLLEINSLVKKVGMGEYIQKKPDLPVTEFEETASMLVDMGTEFGNIIHERKFVEEQLIQYKEKLEEKIEERTMHLSQANSALEEKNKELKELQAQIIQNEKLASIGQLAAGVAHEINNPLGFVSGNFDVLKNYITVITDYLIIVNKLYSGDVTQTVAAAEDYRVLNNLEYILDDLPNLISESEDGIKRVIKIVKNLRNFSRIDSSDFAEYNINTGLEETISIVCSGSENSIKVEKELNAVPLIMANGNELNNVLLNIITNAVQAFDSKPHNPDNTIKIKTYSNAEYLFCEISDNGIGIAENIITRIFDPFFTTKEPGKGTGLGLSMAYSTITKKHGGEIAVKSAAGTGTTFTIKLPLKIRKE